MTRFKFHAFVLSLAVSIAGCASNEDPVTEPEPAKNTASTIPDQSNVPMRERLRVGPTTPKPVADETENIAAVTFGRGVAANDNLDVTFMHNVTRYKDGTASGEFKHSAMTEAGTIDIESDVTCAELDSDSGKGWIGGKVRRNDSTDPSYAGQVDAEVWFRILDLGATEQTALISLPSFKQRGIKGAAAFCDKKPWSDDDLLRISDGALAIFP